MNKSKSRIAEFGEVFTSEREVKAMLELVQQETYRIESRFLEPACGNGNFLIEVLRRKLEVVEEKYSGSQIDFERNTFLAVSSVYGIEIQRDNVEECRERILRDVEESYTAKFESNVNQKFISAIRYVISKNILHGDALNLTQVSWCPIPCEHFSSSQ